MSASISVINAIIAIAGLEAYAISLGINGVLLSGSIAAIAGLGGYNVSKIRQSKKNIQNPNPPPA